MAIRRRFLVYSNIIQQKIKFEWRENKEVLLSRFQVTINFKRFYRSIDIKMKAAYSKQIYEHRNYEITSGSFKDSRLHRNYGNTRHRFFFFTKTHVEIVNQSSSNHEDAKKII